MLTFERWYRLAPLAGLVLAAHLGTGEAVSATGAARARSAAPRLAKQAARTKAAEVVGTAGGGVSLQGATVLLWPEGETGEAKYRTTVGKDGQFRFRGIPAGRYRYRAHSASPGGEGGQAFAGTWQLRPGRNEVTLRGGKPRDTSPRAAAGPLPEVRGLAVANAKQVLADKGFRVTGWDRVPSASVRPGRAVSARPVGSDRATSRNVILSISTGPPEDEAEQKDTSETPKEQSPP